MGILLPRSGDFRWFPAGTGPYFSTWDQRNLLSSALFNTFSYLANKYLTWKPLKSESVNSIIEALNTVMIHMKDKDLQAVLTHLIEELKIFIENNDKQIYSIKLELNQQKRAINEQKQTINRLTMNLDNNEVLYLTNDLGDIYIHYIFEPKYSRLQGKPQTWSMFTDTISQLEEKIHRGQLQRTLDRKPPMNDDEVEAEIAKIYNRIQKEFKVNIRDLPLLKKQRATMVHYGIKTVEQQQKLIEKARRINMPDNFEYRHIFNTVILEPDAFDVKFHRITS